ncbi:MAG: hypothetical protein K6E19_07405 [Lachnospiraceae bacterium]|nr:hypothetical protein [Lachnospiraceae bacterium]
MSTGVYEDKLKNGRANFRASLTCKRKHISLGSYSTRIKAENAYNFATDLLNGKADIPSYPKSCPLLFEKYVSIINLRDNGIYFSTPIYLSKREFTYWLSPERALRFDLDDLFYFSGHKIMERGSRFFIAEYGMQTGLKEHFGIMSFAVPGRDFLFINEDELDYRRENIEIINRYHGVRRIDSLLKTEYKAIIHLRSNYVVGVYKTEKEAAIAYNKAADILTKNGFKKDFMQNYVEGISAKEYADIYTNVRISDKICHLSV